ncbi:hypothetical protein SEA_MOSSY_59 [Gordonia phage Mossy]|nr:hypothetical protein SEA_MOSSY_59 [Gordonia phage Mossy]
MLNLNTVKLVTSTIVGLGTSKIVSTIIKNNVNPETVVDTVTITAGSFVIGSMVADAAKAHTDKMIDQVAEAVTKIKNTINED